MAAWRGALGLGLLLLPAAVLGEDCQAYIDNYGKVQPAKSCPNFCCGNCFLRYCCSNELLKFDAEEPFQCGLLHERTSDLSKLNDMQLSSDPDDFLPPGGSFGDAIAIGIAILAVIIITIILCLTCSCCCLYKACRRPRPVVTTTTATTVVHAAYPQQQQVPPNYPVAPYQGYQAMPIQPQPGMLVAPYPAQCPPPYPMQPPGPPAYNEMEAAGAGAPYPISQPPYNPAYMDRQNPTY
ncbi:protein shisa-5 isoform X1 [Apus apus]|uniref:protein shisa-5 isoform X1 n=1 Tax=Apus apus TaxID=8895 RepID=UPI0021F84BD5|nr:protein shisa-5 isoform X1 [Apus apus]